MPRHTPAPPYPHAHKFLHIIHAEAMQRGMTKNDLCAATGMTLNTIQRLWSCGMLPRLWHLDRLARAVGMKLVLVPERSEEETER